MQVIVVGNPDSQLEAVLKQSNRVAVWQMEPSTARRKAVAGDIIIVDARGMEHVPARVGVWTRELPDCGFILLCSTLDPKLLQEGMRAGIRECLAEPLTQADLEAAISRLAAERATAGSVFAFVGAKGGVGTTTAAVNVATELSRVAPRQTLLVDLHMSNGDAGLFLGEEPRFSVADAIDNVHRLDQAFFKGLVVKSKGHLDLLASPDAAIPSSADAARIRALVEFAALHYRYTVLDVPRSEPAALEALDTANWIVIVANQELATVRNASRMANALRQRYGKERLLMAIARYDPMAGIGQEDIERAVGMKIKHLLPSDYRRAVEALNSGQPLSLGNHNSLAGSFRALARDLAGITAPDETSRPSGGLLGLLKGRRN